MSRRISAARPALSTLLAVLLSGACGLGCGEEAPQLEISKEAVQPGGGPPTQKGKGPTVKSIKNLHAPTPESK